MQLKKLARLGVLTALATATLGTANARAADIKWQTSLSSAQAEARKTHRPLLLYFSTSWCAPCKIMKRTTFKDAAVIRESRRWTMVEIDAEKQDKVAAKYKVVGYPTTIILKPGSVSLETLETIYRDGLPVRIDPAFHAGVEKAAARIAEIAAGDEPVYGINTGFGKLASIRIAAGDVATLQRNLILSHCCGVGEPLSENIVRLIMALKLISLGRGASVQALSGPQVGILAVFRVRSVAGRQRQDRPQRLPRQRGRLAQLACRTVQLA